MSTLTEVQTNILYKKSAHTQKEVTGNGYEGFDEKTLSAFNSFHKYLITTFLP